MRRLLCLLLTCFGSLAMAADPVPNEAGDWARMQAIVPRGYICGRAAAAPKIDGKLDDEAWQAAPWTEEFIDIEGSSRPKPRLGTRAKMLWDDEHFYIAAELKEPHVWGTLKEHDAVIFQDNDFELFIDPDGDNHDYFEFELNAINTGWDLFLPRPYKDGGSADNGWEIPGLRTAVFVDGTLNDATDTDRGWFVELALPWSAFQHPSKVQSADRTVPRLTADALRPQPGQSWRVDFSRVEWQHTIVDGQYRKVPNTKEDNWVWSPQGIIDMHRPERWGFVQFVDQPVGLAEFQQLSFTEDSSLKARDALMNIYHRQRAYREQHKRWAKSLEELALSTTQSDDSTSLTLEQTEDGYQATWRVKQPGGTLQRWHVRQDSRLWRSEQDLLLEQALTKAGDNATELRSALEAVSPREREGLEFLIIHMPEPDLKSLKSEFLVENVKLAYETLDAAPWKDSIPKEIFFNNVLPYASVNERRDNWRKDFRQRFSPLIKEAKTAAQAATLLNQRLYPLVKVKYSTQRKKADQSPYESLNSGLASCTALSVLLIDACRAVGVPARFVGTPLWSDGSGNHSWIEIWDNGWHFTGAAEPNGDELDKAWFIDRASQAKRDSLMNAIYAVSYARTPQKFPMVWARDADYIYAVNVTDRYTALATKPPAGNVKTMFRVIDRRTGQRVPATLHLSEKEGSGVWDGTANDERFDANDHFGINLPIGKVIMLKVDYQSLSHTQEITIPGDTTTVTVTLD